MPRPQIIIDRHHRRRIVIITTRVKTALSRAIHFCNPPLIFCPIKSKTVHEIKY